MLTFMRRLRYFVVSIALVRRSSRVSSEDYSLAFLLQILMTFLTILEFAIIGRALISWFDRGMTSPISQILVQITEPIIAPIRRIVPSAGMLDLSPMVAILLIFALQRMLSTAIG